MPVVTVTYDLSHGVQFHPDNGNVTMIARGSIKFQKGGSQDFRFASFELDPPSQQFSVTLGPDEIDVDDAFTDRVLTAYKYTVGIRLPTGTRAYGDPQIINKPQ